MVKSDVSLRFSLSSAFVIIVLITSLILGMVTYFSVRFQLREGLRQRIGDVVAAASLNISADEHASLKNEADMESQAYKKYREQFIKLRKLNPEIGFLYTLRKVEEGKYLFILDSGETEASGSFALLLEKYNEALSAYFARDWAHAREAFDSVLSLKKDDGPATLLLRKTVQYSLTPPPDSWDGSTVMHEK